MRLGTIAAVAVAVLLVAGCGEPDSDRGDQAGAAPPKTALVQQITSCLNRGWAKIARSASDLSFARATSLSRRARSATTDGVSVADGQAAVSYMPDKGGWRIYTLSKLPNGMNPDYDAIWAQIFEHPQALEIVAFTNDTDRRTAAQRCMNILFEAAVRLRSSAAH